MVRRPAPGRLAGVAGAARAGAVAGLRGAAPATDGHRAFVLARRFRSGRQATGDAAGGGILQPAGAYLGCPRDPGQPRLPRGPAAPGQQWPAAAAVAGAGGHGPGAAADGHRLCPAGTRPAGATEPPAAAPGLCRPRAALAGRAGGATGAAFGRVGKHPGAPDRELSPEPGCLGFPVLRGRAVYRACRHRPGPGAASWPVADLARLRGQCAAADLQPDSGTGGPGAAGWSCGGHQRLPAGRAAAAGRGRQPARLVRRRGGGAVEPQPRVVVQRYRPEPLGGLAGRRRQPAAGGAPAAAGPGQPPGLAPGPCPLAAARVRWP